ncbi:restriction endonuclease subunit S [Methylobacter sp. S3L5C]|uniref:restriction endonuclease subunit S n=1 Tax=Methylobacter sp. S3L5C TaxID=2839024 RepID=UPI001FAC5B97|nr:restriction endonuclease subunit S [Methylobacter sp. S3L5C]UOA09703.1 restriction endonuclease subunit S [Methylobacter sp. S3L5C]
MNAIQTLITEHIDIWTAADTAKKSGRGRSSGNAASVYGIKKLRELILELAVRGKLVPQDANDEPASELLKRIEAEKAKLIAEGKVKKTKLLPLITEEEKPFELPQSWGWARLGTIGISSTGRTPSTQKSALYDGSIPFIGPGQITLACELLPAEKWLSEAGRNETTIAKTGDILMVCIGGSIGKSAIADKEMGFNQQINCISPFCVENKFAHISVMANSFQSKILEFATGSATPIINKSKWEELLVPVSPLAEQQRIVAKVDELMALCDQLENQHSNATEAHEKLVSYLLDTLTQSQSAEDFNTNWQRIAAHFDTLFTSETSIDALKQTLLQLAVMGKLVPQDPNDEPASELLKRIQIEKTKLIAEGKIKKAKPLAPITEEEKPFDIPQNWEWVKPEEFSIKITDGEHFRPPTEENGVYFLSAKDVREEGVSLDDPLFISEETAKKALQRCNPEYGDLLIVSRGATVGRMCKVNIDEKFCLLGSVILGSVDVSPIR